MWVMSREEDRMSPQVCPRCGSAIPTPQPYCGQCGAPLSSTSLVPRSNRALTPATARLPAPLSRAVRPVVVLSVVGLGLRLLQAWLQHRQRRSQAQAGELVSPPSLAEPPARRIQRISKTRNADKPQRIVVVQRTIQVWVAEIRGGGF